MGGRDFVHGVIDGKIIFWGGLLEQEINDRACREFRHSPKHIVHTFDISSGLQNLWTESDPSAWERKAATGSIHPGVSGAAFTTLNGKIYLFGGCVNYASSNEGTNAVSTNAVSTLDPSGHFERVHPVGETPPNATGEATISLEKHTSAASMKALFYILPR